MWADIDVFDPEKIHDVATFEKPNQLSVGMQYVLVNGVPVIAGGKATNTLPGKVLRGPGYQKSKTLAELSNFQQTGRTDEVERLSSELARTWPDAVNSFEYGRSGEGRPMRALVVSRTGALTAEQIRARKIPLLMLQGGIHPGESDGKDAGFIAIREMLEGAAAARSFGQDCHSVCSCIQHGRTRAHGALESSQPGGAGGDRLAHHRPRT